MDISRKQLVTVQDELREMGAAISGSVTVDEQQGNRAAEVAEVLLESGTAVDYFNVREDGTRITSQQSGFTEARRANQEALCAEIARGLPESDRALFDLLAGDGKKGFGERLGDYGRARKIQSRVLMAFGRIVKAMMPDAKAKVTVGQCFAAIAVQCKKLEGMKLSPKQKDALAGILAALATVTPKEPAKKAKAPKVPKPVTATVKAKKPSRVSKPLI